KTSLITPRAGGIVAYASDAFGPFIGFQTTICYWISAWIGNVALLVAGVGYLSYFFPALHNPVYGCITAIAILWAFIALGSPERTVPRATVYGLLIASVCYVGSCTVIMGLVPHAELVKSAAPFADAARYMFGDMAGNIASALSIIACFGSISGWLILQSEGPRAGAKQGLFPQIFAETNKNDVPMKGLIISGVLMSLVLLLTASPDLAKQFQVVILMSVFASLLPYMYAIIALPIIMVSKKLN
ncbi:histidine-histamine antiporter, partial [Klebsiella aerogenes]